MTKKTEPYKAMPTPEESSQRDNDFITPVYNKEDESHIVTHRNHRTRFTHAVTDVSIPRRK